MYLINFQFQVMHYAPENGVLYNTGIFDIVEDRAVKLKSFNHLPDFQDGFVFSTQNVIEQNDHIPGLGDVVISYDPSRPCFTVRNAEGKYLCWDMERYSLDRLVYDTWEYFLLISDDDIARLRYLKSNNWVSQRTGQLYTPDDIVFEDKYLIRIGAFRLDYRFSNARDFGVYEYTGFVDGWKPELFSLYRPLVYITAYSDRTVLEQLHLCVRSLRDIGKFNGKIVVMTDQDRETICALCEEPLSSPLEIDTLHPKDFAGYVCSKYHILDRPPYEGYQPLLYSDPDIIFDRPIEPMLVAATAVNEVCAPLEVFHRLRSHISIGSGLLQLDQIDPGPYAAGFNGGTIIIPNTQNTQFRWFVEMVERTVANIGARFGRDYNGWADQEVVNYIAFKFGICNTSTITRFAQFIDHHPDVKNNRLGFVHFWGHKRDDRVWIMRNYLHKLYELDGIEREISVSL